MVQRTPISAPFSTVTRSPSQVPRPIRTGAVTAGLNSTLSCGSCVWSLSITVQPVPKITSSSMVTDSEADTMQRGLIPTPSPMRKAGSSPSVQAPRSTASQAPRRIITRSPIAIFQGP